MKLSPALAACGWIAGALLFGCVVSTPAIAAPPSDYAIAEGDIVFQSLPRSPLVDAIEGATASRWSHCGIVVRDGGAWAVLEAIGPVKITPWDAWVRQARDDAFIAYRVRDRSDDLVAALIDAAKSFLGRPYDIRYEMDDAKIYCSELVEKAFREATGRPLGKLRRVGRHELAAS